MCAKNTTIQRSGCCANEKSLGTNHQWSADCIFFSRSMTRVVREKLVFASGNEMENSESPSYSNNSTQSLLVSSVLSPDVHLHSNVIKNESNNPSVKGYSRRCKKCRKTFKNQGTYLSHVRIHKNSAKLKRPRGHSVNQLQHQEFYCKACDVTCSGLVAFVEHLKEHPAENQQISVSSFLSSINNQHEDDDVNQADHLSTLNGIQYITYTLF